jgi:hypothetical protein
MFENTRWSNPNYQPNFNYAERVEAARQGMPWYNIGSDIAQTIGRAGESVMQKLYTNEILKQLYGEPEQTAPATPAATASQPIVVAGGGGSQTEVGNPLLASRVEPLTKAQYDDLVKKYYYGMQMADQPMYDFTYGVV